MTLINCPECGNEVSVAADACPNCGHPVEFLLDPRRRWDWNRIINFKSRTLRCEFWAAWVVGFGVTLVTGSLLQNTSPLVGLFFTLASLALLIWLHFGSTANRFHDMGMSGALALLLLVPFVNLAVIVWVGVWKGEPGPNQWGRPVS
jgi:uncharacterized membrane protein YhaH (DUF805 family)